MDPAVKLDIIIPDDRRLELDLPNELPAGPAEIIVRPVPREPPGSSAVDSPESLADLFAGHIGLIDSGSTEPVSEKGAESFAAYLEEKRRAGHL